MTHDRLAVRSNVVILVACLAVVAISVVLGLGLGNVIVRLFG